MFKLKKQQLKSALPESIQCVYLRNNTETVSSVVSVSPRVGNNVSIEANQWLMKFRKFNIATHNHHNKCLVFTKTRREDIEHESSFNLFSLLVDQVA